MRISKCQHHPVYTSPENIFFCNEEPVRISLSHKWKVQPLYPWAFYLFSPKDAVGSVFVSFSGFFQVHSLLLNWEIRKYQRNQRLLIVFPCCSQMHSWTHWKWLLIVPSIMLTDAARSALSMVPSLLCLKWHYHLLSWKRSWSYPGVEFKS